MTDKSPAPKKAVPVSAKDSVSPEPEAEPTKAAAPTPPKAGNHVIGEGDTDTVHLSQAIYQNKKARKSLTVHHLQRRLWDWGFTEASADPDGYYSDLTKRSVEAFQKHVGLEVTGEVDKETFKRLFEGDHNVELVLF